MWLWAFVAHECSHVPELDLQLWVWVLALPPSCLDPEVLTPHGESDHIRLDVGLLWFSGPRAVPFIKMQMPQEGRTRND